MQLCAGAEELPVRTRNARPYQRPSEEPRVSFEPLPFPELTRHGQATYPCPRAWGHPSACSRSRAPWETWYCSELADSLRSAQIQVVGVRLFIHLFTH